MKQKENSKKERMLPISKNLDKLSLSFEKNTEAEGQTIKIISKEIDKIVYFIQYREKISSLIKKFITISEKYATDIYNLTLDLKQNDISFEGKINTVFHDIMRAISNNMNKMLTDISEELKSRKNKLQKEENKSKDFLPEIQKLKFLLTNTMKITENDKQLYLYEFKNYEEYLVRKELGQLKNNKNNLIETKSNNNFEIIEKLVDNHKQVYDKQNAYKKSKENSNKIIQHILNIIINEKKIIHEDIFYILYNFVIQMHKFSQMLNNNCLEQKNNLDLPIFQLNNDKEQKTFDSLLKSDYYHFKCLENVNSSFNESKNVINIQNKLDYLSEDQIINILNEVKKNEIIISDFDEEKLNIVRKRYNIISIIKLIITDSTKYDEKLKNEFINLLKNDKDSLCTFIQFINNNRIKGQYILSKKAFNEMTDLFTILIEYLVKNKNFLQLKKIFLMSSTYCLEENGIKKSLSNNIKKLKILEEKAFWENYLEVSIMEELNENKKRSQDENLSQKQQSLAIFASILATIQDMIEYEVDIKLVNFFLENHVYKKYTITEENKKEIEKFLESKINSGKINDNNNKLESKEKKKKNEDIENNIITENKIEID